MRGTDKATDKTPHDHDLVHGPVRKIVYLAALVLTGMTLALLGAGWLSLPSPFPIALAAIQIFLLLELVRVSVELRRLFTPQHREPVRRQRIHEPSQNLDALPAETGDFKDFLASAPLEGIDLTRSRSVDRPVEL
jgi:hypothetical protein